MVITTGLDLKWQAQPPSSEACTSVARSKGRGKWNAQRMRKRKKREVLRILRVKLRKRSALTASVPVAGEQ